MQFIAAMLLWQVMLLGPIRAFFIEKYLWIAGAWSKKIFLSHHTILLKIIYLNLKHSWAVLVCSLLIICLSQCNYSAALCGPWNKNNIEATLRFFCDTWPLEYWKNFFEQSPHYIYCICLFFSDSSAFLWLLSFHITSRVWLNAWVFVYVLGSSPVAVT